MGESEHSGPAPTDTLPREKQHGPISGCTASSLSHTHTHTHAARLTHQLLSSDRPSHGAAAAATTAGFTHEQRKSTNSRSILGKSVMVSAS
ncbi:hypothetical protein JOB18_028664 [Solea senegalensis]|uniref:Uncharacterized protein n=1 Tax=Solea senegalensis TaxID=28829 RepID=A0AAV6T009_SOLSE|nr:hypothetical protein JOB18_028664 [Solea senegalensis]